MIFGSANDVGTLLHIGRELLQDVVEQEILLYKVSLEETVENIYGEASQKFYWTPVRLTCRIKRGSKDWQVQDYGPDINRITEFAFFKEDLRDLETIIEPGDIIEWSKDYYEVDGIDENQMFLGKDLDYRISTPTWKFGSSISIIAKTHLSRLTKLNVRER